MQTFVMLGTYSSQDALDDISSKRTAQAKSVIKKLGGKVKSIYALLGDNDLLLIVDLPGVLEAMKASVTLSEMSGIAFTTSPAITVQEFDKEFG